MALLLALGGAFPAVAQEGASASTRRTGSERQSGEDPDRAAVVRVVNLFYRDLAAGQWNDVQNHFWPAKVAARWPAPFEEREEPPPAGPIQLSSSGTSSGGSPACVGESSTGGLAVSFIGRWARVADRACPPAIDPGGPASAYAEVWLLNVEGIWKIVYLR